MFVIMLKYKVDIAFDFSCNQLDETYRAVFSGSAVNYVIQGNM